MCTFSKVFSVCAVYSKCTRPLTFENIQVSDEVFTPMLLSCISLGCARAELDPVVGMIDGQGYGFDTSGGLGSILVGPRLALSLRESYTASSIVRDF